MLRRFRNAANQYIEEALTELFSLDTWTFVSAMHVDEVVAGLRPGSHVLSIGGGPRIETDRLLASRHSKLRFHGTDLAADCSGIRLPGNLTWGRLDICAETGQAGFDLVWSVECLEHIKDDALAVHNACSFVRPGGQLLLIVPFANQQEQKDPSVIQGERRFGHVVAGYDADRLTQLIGRDQFNEIRLENCYWRETYALRLYRNAVFPAMGSRVLVQLEALARTDIRPGALAENRTQALGIKVLATGRRSGTEQRRGYQGLFSPQGSGEGLYPADRNPSGMIGLASKVAGMATAGIGRCR